MAHRMCELFSAGWMRGGEGFHEARECCSVQKCKISMSKSGSLVRRMLFQTKQLGVQGHMVGPGWMGRRTTSPNLRVLKLVQTP